MVIDLPLEASRWVVSAWFAQLASEKRPLPDRKFNCVLGPIQVRSAPVFLEAALRI